MERRGAVCEVTRRRRKHVLYRPGREDETLAAHCGQAQVIHVIRPVHCPIPRGRE